jgi:ubiquinone/menaquinone biosynthesis C-methylase UbiE
MGHARRGIQAKVNSTGEYSANMKVLDLGCGSGTLTLILKRAHPNANITGMDGDPQVLKIAREKSCGMNIQWDEGLASFLPYPDSVFDRVITSLVIHHLTTADKRRTFKGISRDSSYDPHELI